ncbi:MAG: SH3 domain-containing protein [Candidatus Omnitrophica bacterium]|nr:SH3 domain-containing protein [Candidatus Omnitrophota bacterium]
MLKALKILTFALLIISCPFILLAADFKAFLGEVSSDNINLRSNSTVSSEVIYKLHKGEQVYVAGELYEWYKVKLPKSAPSFIKKELVAPINSNAAKVDRDTVNIRLGPNESSAILGKAHRDELVNILQDSGAWYRIEPIDNSFGWVNKKFVRLTQAPAKKEEPLSAAAAAKTVELNKTAAQNPSEPQAVVIYEGVIHPYGKVFFRTATHKLVMKDNTVLYLKGNKQVLNAVLYRKVKIVGKFIGDPNQKNPIIEVEKIEALD